MTRVLASVWSIRYLALVSRHSRWRLMLLLNSATQLSTSSRSLSFSSTSRGFTASAMNPALVTFRNGFSPASIHLEIQDLVI